MAYSPPTKKTVMFSLICVLLGIILGILGFLNLIPSAGGVNWNNIMVYIGFGLCFLAWLLMYIGVRMHGV